MRAWRFGEVDKPAGGFGVARGAVGRRTRRPAAAPVDPDAARWWEIYGTLRWGVICIMQAAAHRLGITRSVELAAIGRRTCENEHDLLALLPGRPMPPATDVDGDRRVRRPTTARRPPSWPRRCGSGSRATSPRRPTGRVRFHARVAANVLAMIERELRLGPATPPPTPRASPASGSTTTPRWPPPSGPATLDDRWDEVRTAVWSSVRDKLAVAHPGYDDELP